MASPLFDGEGLVTRRVRVDRDQVAWVRYVLEAYDGLAHLHSSGGGTLTLVAPTCRAEELDEVIGDLAAEITLERLPELASEPAPEAQSSEAQSSEAASSSKLDTGIGR